MANLWTPDENYRRPYCRKCGLSYTHPKFGGKVIVAHPAGQNGKAEIVFCESCAKTDEAQEIYRELMDMPGQGLIYV